MEEDIYSIEAREAADLNAKTRADTLAERDRLALEQETAELAASEAECTEIDRRDRREMLRPPDIGREGTEARTAYERQQASDKRARQRLEILRGKKRQNEVGKENRTALESQEN